MEEVGGRLYHFKGSHCLSCRKCETESGTSCEGPVVNCSPGSMCGVMYSSYTGYVSQKVYSMLCLSPNYCNIKGSFSNTMSSMKIATSCCTNDRCIPTLPSLPEENTVPNGLTCSDCMFTDNPKCANTPPTQCRGNEIVCVPRANYIGGLELVRLVYGCATQSMCDFGKLFLGHDGSLMIFAFTCPETGNAGTTMSPTTSGTTSFQKGFYLPAIINLLFLKLMF
ncbi:uncharacterized protein [Hyperolius riggenbachi]|uniref:uncharacterized protein n=1 Tax=Hyperolius riggenbachi TaxID=752182 RepID=UPI0035A26A02